MIQFVIKKDGTKVPFDPEKIKSSIMAACDDVGVTEDEKNDITSKVSSAVMTALEGKEETTTTEIKNIILAELDVSYMNIAESWRTYEAGKGE